MTTQPRPARRTYVRSDDVGLYRHPLALGLITFGGFYGALTAAGPLAIAIGAGASIAFVTYVWRMVESDGRAIEVEWKAATPEPVRPMSVTSNGGAGRTITLARRSWDVETLRAIGKQAARNGGMLTRDVLKAAGAPRDIYQDTGPWQEEWVALGFATKAGRSVRLTPRGAEFHANPQPLPQPTVRQLEHV